MRAAELVGLIVSDDDHDGAGNRSRNLATPALIPSYKPEATALQKVTGVSFTASQCAPVPPVPLFAIYGGRRIRGQASRDTPARQQGRAEGMAYRPAGRQPCSPPSYRVASRRIDSRRARSLDARLSSPARLPGEAGAASPGSSR